MQKIPTLFDRDWKGDRSRVLDVVTPGTEWVIAGEGVATRKRDGTATMMIQGALYKRYDAKKGRKPPEGFRPAQETPDEITGHWPGWLRVESAAPENWWFALAKWPDEDGTYEFCGPQVGQNREQLDGYTFFRHGGEPLEAPRTYVELATFFASTAIEGIVWHHPDGRMVKIKARDFGVDWPRLMSDSVNEK